MAEEGCFTAPDLARLVFSEENLWVIRFFLTTDFQTILKSFFHFKTYLKWYKCPTYPKAALVTWSLAWVQVFLY